MYILGTRRLKGKMRLTQRAPDPRQRAAGAMVGLAAFSGSLRGLELVLSKRRSLVPPTSG